MLRQGRLGVVLFSPGMHSPRGFTVRVVSFSKFFFWFMGFYKPKKKKRRGVLLRVLCAKKRKTSNRTCVLLLGCKALSFLVVGFRNRA